MKMGNADFRRVCNALSSRSILQFSEDGRATATIHDTVRDCTRDQRRDQKKLHLRILQEFAKQLQDCRESFGGDPLDGAGEAWFRWDVVSDGYVHENLTYYLAGARRTKELADLVLDGRWTRVHRKAGSYEAVSVDYERTIREIERKRTDDSLFSTGEVLKYKKALARRYSSLWQQAGNDLLPAIILR
jgi:hypothetical protein